MTGLKRVFWRIVLILLVLAILSTLGIIGINNHVKRAVKEDIACVIQSRDGINAVTSDALKQFDADCIIVLGAGIKDKETPSPMLQDRLDVGIALYQAGVAPKILLTGDNGQVEHNEIHVMLKYTKAAGVPEQDIFCDHAGFSTYDSLYRAGSIFQVKRAVVVTQTYHEYRALYIGKKQGLAVIGAASDQQKYFGSTYRELREVLARCKDFFKCLFHSDAQLDGEVIPINGSGISSHGE